MMHVDLGATTVEIPVAIIKGNTSGKTLLVTAGMDGDEYASIDAAYRMIQELGKRNFIGQVVVIPIVNMPGFDKEVSYNPLDEKYPKLVGVGKKDGTPTERLMHWVVDTYAVHASMWLDLHGGSLTEVFEPFLWAWETKVKPVDLLVSSYCQNHAPSFSVFEEYSMPGKAAVLAGKGCSYIIAEAGGSCERKESDIDKHCTWVRSAMESLGMKAPTGGEIKKTPLYRKYRQYASNIQGLWHPQRTDIRKIRKGDILGLVRSFDLSREEKIMAKEDAQVLWIKEGMKSSNKEILIAVAYSQW